MAFLLLSNRTKAASFDHRLAFPQDSETWSGDSRFIPVQKAATFAGDPLSLNYLRWRIERSNFVSERAKSALRVEATAPASECVVVVDAFSTGACLAYEAAQRGYAIIHVLSLEPSDELAAMVPAHLRGALPWLATLYLSFRVELAAAANELAAELRRLCEAKGLRLAAVMPGAETGVKLADALSEAVVCGRWARGARTNGTNLSEARRNKAEMGEAVRRAGVRAVRQLRADAWPPVAKWLADEWRLPTRDEAKCLLVLKPLESAGTSRGRPLDSTGPQAATA